jgi:hypothetical protein
MAEGKPGVGSPVQGAKKWVLYPDSCQTALAEWLNSYGLRNDIILKTHSGLMNAYCVKEKKNREIDSPKEVTFKNGRHAIRGKCSSCGTTLFRITGK